MKTILMCDVDSILVDFVKIATEVAPDLGFKWPDTNWWASPSECGKTLNDFYELFRVCHSERFFLDQEPYDGAVETLNTLVIDYPELEISYVSHRSEEDNHVLHNWLTKWKFPYASSCVSTFNKIEWIEFNSPYIVIDDRVRTMIAARDLGVKNIFSLIHPWNCNLKHDEISRIKLAESWKELGEMLNMLLGSAN